MQIYELSYKTTDTKFDSIYQTTIQWAYKWASKKNKLEKLNLLFFNGMINIEYFHSNLLKIDKLL